MKIVLDNIVFFLQRSGGMSVYWNEIISRLEHYKKFEIRYLEPDDRLENIFYDKIRQEIKPKISFEKRSAKILSFLFYRENFGSKHIFHSSYYRTAKTPSAINVVTIHDFIPEFFFKGFKRIFHSYRKKKAIENAHGIICISKNTCDDLVKYYPSVQSIPIKIIYNGVSDEYYPINIPDTKIGFAKKYILFVGKRPPYKNFSFVVDVLLATSSYHLIIVGDALTKREKKLLSNLGDRYALIKNPNNKELNQLYNNAHCLLYPSSYEGFGIPIVEAMKAGCPVVALRAGSIPEVAGDSALLVEQLNIQEFLKKITQLEDSSLRNQIINRGIENAKRFNWDRTVSELISFYESLYYNSNG